MKQARGSLARADLLRSMAAFEQAGASADAVRDMAQRLQFFVDAKAAQSAPEVLPALAGAGGAAVVSQVADTPPVLVQPANLPALEVALFDIVHIKLLEKAQPTQERQALRVEQYKPRQTEPLSFAALLPTPRLVRRMREALAQSHAGRALDVTRAVHLLAQGHTPARWPRLAWSHAPEQVTVLVDRALHLRPYWHDQDQLVHTLAQWIGPNQIITYTVQGDPWQPLACWSRGAERTPVPALAPAAVGQTVLLLTDMGALAQAVAGGASTASVDRTGSVRWGHALRWLGSAGARVLLCPPCSAGLFAGALAPACACWPVAWYAPGQVGTRVAAARQGAGAPQAERAAALELLLTLLACARRIEPELVRALRRLVPQLAAEPGLEAQLWACSDCLEIGFDVCGWRADKVMLYRNKFEQGPETPDSGISVELQQAVLSTMLNVHAVRGRAIEVQELLVWASHVSEKTAVPWQKQINDAHDWMAALPLGVGTAGVDEAGLLAFARQTQAAQGGDDALMQRYPDAFGPLWGLVHRAAESEGEPLPQPGALPAERLAHYRQLVQPAGQVRQMYLRQVGQQLLLSAVPQGAAGPLPLACGMPLSTAKLTVSRRQGDERRFGWVSEFHNLTQQEYGLGPTLPQQAYLLHTDTLALEVGEVLPPFAAAERGRDKYGLYADLHFMPPDIVLPAGAKTKGKKKKKTVAKAVAVELQKLRFRYIAPGQFLMGSPEDEVGRYDDESPQHPVLISQGFWMLDTACAQGLWQAVMGNNPSHFNGKDGPGGLNHPVEKVSWDDVQQFLQKLATVLGKNGLGLLTPDCQVTLPTEAEWEYACRAGSATAYHFGDYITTDLVNYSGKFSWGDDKVSGEYRTYTVNVVQFSANFWGLYQMHGNVWEWCADERRDYRATVGDAVLSDPGLAAALAPLAGGQQGSCALRGGSWLYNAQSARSACRFMLAPGARYEYLGFRFVLRFGSQAKQGF